jgi:hypothetical protein
MFEPPPGIVVLPRALDYLARAECYYGERGQAKLFAEELKETLEGVLNQPRYSEALGFLVVPFPTLDSSVCLEFPLDRTKGISVTAIFGPHVFDPPPPLDEGLLGKPAGVPRRFSLGVMLAFTLAFAGLFWVLRLMNVEAYKVGLIALFFALVGLGQAFLFGGKKPRAASVLVGIGYCWIAMAIPVGIREYERNGGLFETIVYSAGTSFCPAILFGAVAGYGCGGLLAAMFLRLSPPRPPDGEV